MHVITRDEYVDQVRALATQHNTTVLLESDALVNEIAANLLAEDANSPGRYFTRSIIRSYLTVVHGQDAWTQVEPIIADLAIWRTETREQPEPQPEDTGIITVGTITVTDSGYPDGTIFTHSHGSQYQQVPADDGRTWLVINEEWANADGRYHPMIAEVIRDYYTVTLPEPAVSSRNEGTEVDTYYVGDRVLCIYDTVHGLSEQCWNGEGVVNEIVNDRYIEILFDRERHDRGGFNPADLRLLERGPNAPVEMAYPAGTELRVIGHDADNPNGTHCLEVGDIVTVLSEWEHYTQRANLMVVTYGDHGGTQGLTTNEVEPVVAAAPTFSVGQQMTDEMWDQVPVGTSVNLSPTPSSAGMMTKRAHNEWGFNRSHRIYPNETGSTCWYIQVLPESESVVSAEPTIHPIGTAIRVRGGTSTYTRVETDERGRCWRGEDTGSMYGGGTVLSDEIIEAHYDVIESPAPEPAVRSQVAESLSARLLTGLGLPSSVVAAGGTIQAWSGGSGSGGAVSSHASGSAVDLLYGPRGTNLGTGQITQAPRFATEVNVEALAQQVRDLRSEFGALNDAFTRAQQEMTRMVEAMRGADR